MTFKQTLRTTTVTLFAALMTATAVPVALQAQEVRPPFAAAVPQGAPMSFADLIERVSPSVVSIEANGTVAPQATPDTSQLPPQFRDFFERFGGVPQEPRERRAQGSGFFISQDGLVVTNFHVIREADDITVVLKDGERYPAEIVGTDAETDLALLRVEGSRTSFPFVTLDATPSIRVGDWVVAVGNPFGLGGTATAGIVSAIGRPIGAVYTDFLQIDAPINSGNSGGPAFDLNGNVIGVNSAIFSPTGGNVGIGFAIPSDLAASVVAQLIEGGQVRRGYLGVRPQTLTADLKDALGLDSDLQGVLLAEVFADTPAGQAGLESEDVVLRVDGEDVTSPTDLTRQIGAMPPGQVVEMRVLRDGRERTIRVTLAERPDSANAPTSAETPSGEAFFGMTLAPADDAVRERLNLEGNRGLVVSAVARGSEAATKGISVGDVILEAGGRDVARLADFTAAVDDARERGRSAVLVLVASQSGVRYAALQFESAE